MSDQSKLGLGQIITTEQHRDAIHVAVAPIKAGMQLQPGSHVYLESGEAMQTNIKGIGVVDPFLKTPVQQGETFWLFLYPGTITGLRHEWAHPAFGPEEKKLCDIAASEKWLREYANTHCSYDAPNAYEPFMQRVRMGEIFYHGSDCHGLYDVEDADELFQHLSVVLGRSVGGHSFEYSCSC